MWSKKLLSTKLLMGQGLTLFTKPIITKIVERIRLLDRYAITTMMNGKTICSLYLRKLAEKDIQLLHLLTVSRTYSICLSDLFPAPLNPCSF